MVGAGAQVGMSVVLVMVTARTRSRMMTRWTMVLARMTRTMMQMEDLVEDPTEDL